MNANSRKSTGKRLRFEIFKRDNFTCQYCGAQPPDVVLVIDHIIPVSKGGDNDPTNLITACEPCNQGKANKSLSQIAPRPDADLEWLEAQQELAELRRYRIVKQERDQLLDEIADDLVSIYEKLSGVYYQTEKVRYEIGVMLSRYSPEIVEDGLKVVAQKVKGGYIYRSDWKQYAYGVMNNMERER